MPLVRILADRPIKAGAGEAEDTADGQAQVRDTEDPLEVIVVQRTGDQIRLIGVDGPPGNVVPTDSHRTRRTHGQRRACTIRMPYQLAVLGQIGLLVGDLEGPGIQGGSNHHGWPEIWGWNWTTS